MSVIVDQKFAVDVTYNGVTKPLQVESTERVTALLRRAIALFGVTQNAHLLSLFRLDGTVVDEGQSVEQSGLKPGQELLLRPNVVKGGFERLKVAGDVLPATFEALRTCGQGEYECAVYWLGPSDERAVDGVEHPVHTRSSFGYEVQSDWLTDFWKRLAAGKRSVKAQVHSHPREAFHSGIDDCWPIVSQAGFLSIVVPDFAKGRPTLDDAWVGIVKRDGRWRRVTSAADVLVIS